VTLAYILSDYAVAIVVLLLCVVALLAFWELLKMIACSVRKSRGGKQ